MKTRKEITKFFETRGLTGEILTCGPSWGPIEGKYVYDRYSIEGPKGYGLVVEGEFEAYGKTLKDILDIVPKSDIFYQIHKPQQEV